jgi:PncC family amidohydrolase
MSDKAFETASSIADLLIARKQRVAVGESSAGGLISAALLSVAGASAFYLGGAVLYTKRAVMLSLDLTPDLKLGIRSSSEPYARMVADRMRDRYRADWAIVETGAAGPSGNTYGDPPGHSCMAVSGPIALVHTLETGLDDRRRNMALFAESALDLLLAALKAVPQNNGSA